ncbi:MAG: 16S rRNA (cytosine(1402)-N(4))-methyltransferase RsmH [Firmicutes bacterium]|nr:16S rRNA (cytosine(1402)-N(4))-methyltransferase RsmH [Bacillota bacterium]
MDHHRPVLLEETVDALEPRPGGVYVDCTLGAGGHSQLLLERSAPTGTVVGIDQDSRALKLAAGRLDNFRKANRLFLVHSNYDFLLPILAGLGYSQVDGIVFDLGFSSMQIDDPERGFSYRFTAPLDMRMDRNQELTAADLVNTASEEELSRIIKDYGEERWAKRIARAIVTRRQERPLQTTTDLVEAIMEAYPAPNRDGTHPARRTFQALRIAVNRELERLEDALGQAISLLKPGGRIAVISFHSLEDRTVKHLFKQEAAECICPPGLPVCTCGHRRQLEIITKKPIVPGSSEVKSNPRSRSAKLRVAQKVVSATGNEE